MLSSGFTSAPISKVLFFATIVSSLLVSITDTKHLFHIQLFPHLLRYRQLWRLLIWQFCYVNSTELLFAAMTMYHMRVVERLWGSRKFASFLLSTLPPTLLLAPLTLLLLRPLTLNHLNILPAGPTPLLFALLAQYHAAIPTIYKYHLVTSSSTSSTHDPPFLTLSDKSLIYLLSAQLALSTLPGSIISAIVGWGVGVAWRAEVGPTWWTRWRCPGWIVGEASGGRSGEGIERLRARLEGERGRGSGSGRDGEDREGSRRRGLGRGILDQFRGAF